MNFPIEIRHVESGLAKVFYSIEAVAEFLGQRVKEEWEGWTHLSAHPAFKASLEAAAADPIGQHDHTDLGQQVADAQAAGLYVAPTEELSALGGVASPSDPLGLYPQTAASDAADTKPAADTDTTGS